MSSPSPAERELRRRPASVETVCSPPLATSPTLSSPSTSVMTAVTKSSPSPTAPSVPIPSPMKPPAQAQKRRSTSQNKSTNDVDDGGPQGAKRRRQSKVLTNGIPSSKEDMFETYQPWVIQTYGDSAKTKTITLRKYARVLRTLRGEESNSVENSKFRFWVKAKGFRIGQPPGYVPKPADAIVGTQTLSDDKEGGNKDPPLYVPTSTGKCLVSLHAGEANASLVWQLKLLAAHVLSHASSSLLVSPGLALSVHQNVSLLLDTWQPDLTPLMQQYITSHIQGCSSVTVQRLVAFLIYSDIPSPQLLSSAMEGDKNPLALYNKLQSLGLSSDSLCRLYQMAQRR